MRAVYGFAWTQLISDPCVSNGSLLVAATACNLMLASTSRHHGRGRKGALCVCVNVPVRFQLVPMQGTRTHTHKPADTDAKRRLVFAHKQPNATLCSLTSRPPQKRKPPQTPHRTQTRIEPSNRVLQLRTGRDTREETQHQECEPEERNREQEPQILARDGTTSRLPRILLVAIRRAAMGRFAPSAAEPV